MILAEKIEKAYASILARTGSIEPRVGVILGSGFSGWVETIQIDQIIPYPEISGFPATTVVGHKGQLVLGSVRGVKVLVMQGRFHYYEGHDMHTLSIPIRVFYELGIRTMIITNAAGGINTTFETGDLMVIEDHINFSSSNPLIGPNLEKYGTRFPDASRIYTPALVDLANDISEELSIALRQGVYLFTTGPSFETPAEVRMMRTLGADAVGMSTVPEAIVANHAGMDVFGLSLISNMASGLSEGELNHLEVMQAMSKVATQANDFISLLISRL